MEQTIKDFRDYLQSIHHLKGALRLMSFDANTGAPKGGVKSRSARMGYIYGEMFGMQTSAKMEEFINKLSGASSLDKETAAMLRISKKTFESNKKIPQDMMRQFMELRTQSHVVWEGAKKDNDFDVFAPYLQKIIKMQREMLALRGTGSSPYNILLDDYEEGLTMDDCDVFFTKLKGAIVPLLKKISDSGVSIDTTMRNMAVPIKNQRQISEFIAKKVGYDLERGMIKESEHPFCNGTDQDDVRITTHYYEKDFLASFYAVLHECGHAIYEQNISKSVASTILDTGISMGIHESQSRFYENVLGRSLEFWEHVTDELKTYLPSEFGKYSAQDFYRAVNVAGPSFIRIEADELTYSLHIMIRYEMERLIFNEDVDITKLPQIWNEKTEQYLGITPPNNSKGILQDVHWSEGLMGYFPSYSLGSALSSQYMHYMQKEMDVNALVRKGDFATITSWLQKNVHTHGSIYTPKELVKQALGEDLNPDYYVNYLTEKFTKVYGL